MRYITPLRYPGGKSKLVAFIKCLLQANALVGGEYFEPYAGGASVALHLLFNQYVNQVHINDLSRSVYSFWWAVLQDTEGLCKLINDTPITMESWLNQKAIQSNPSAHSTLELGFSTFFLNRTNRSGIISSGGVIGGKDQQGEWHLDARFNKPNLITRITTIGQLKDRISLYNEDAQRVLEKVVPKLPRKSFIYLDPPYYSKGRRLYDNNYQHAEHEAIAAYVRQMDRKWMVSYDNSPEVVKLYSGCRYIEYELSYTANTRSSGSEIMFFSNDLTLPPINASTRLKLTNVNSA